MGLFFSGSHQDNFGQKVNRDAVVAGSFYPGSSHSLEETLGRLFLESEAYMSKGKPRALIVPHAGYSYSGAVAAAGYSQIDPDASYKNIFILASSHHVSLGKASVYDKGNYSTPLGEVPVNLEICSQLIAENDCFVFSGSAHSREHSIEVQLPFIQHHIKNGIPIVPIVLATQDPEVCRDIAEALRPWFTDDNLFIISADFSHYPDYKSAVKIDGLTADALCTGDPEKFLATIRANAEMKVPGLVTSMCAWPAGLSLLYLVNNNSELVFNKILYRNSGDYKINQMKSEVVGYHAISLSRKGNPGILHLTGTEKEELLRISREALETYIQTKTKAKLNPDGDKPGLMVETGAFVSLKKEGKLRGCIGSLSSDAPLFSLVQSLTIAAATEDSRFLPVQKKELGDIGIEISVLTPMRKIHDINEIVLGKHGIYIRKDGMSGTFLPQVASETGWPLEEFLGRCARDKAGIGWDGWKDAEIFTYEAIVFKEKESGKSK